MVGEYPLKKNSENRKKILELRFGNFYKKIENIRKLRRSSQADVGTETNQKG